MMISNELENLLFFIMGFGLCTLVVDCAEYVFSLSNRRSEKVLRNRINDCFNYSTY